VCDLPVWTGPRTLELQLAIRWPSPQHPTAAPVRSQANRIALTSASVSESCISAHKWQPSCSSVPNPIASRPPKTWCQVEELQLPQRSSHDMLYAAYPYPESTVPDKSMCSKEYAHFP